MREREREREEREREREMGREHKYIVVKLILVKMSHWITSLRSIILIISCCLIQLMKNSISGLFVIDPSRDHCISHILTRHLRYLITVIVWWYCTLTHANMCMDKTMVHPSRNVILITCKTKIKFFLTHMQLCKTYIPLKSSHIYLCIILRKNFH